MSSLPFAILALVAGVSATDAAFQQKPDAPTRTTPPSATPRMEAPSQISLADLGRADVMLAMPVGDKNSPADGTRGKVADLVVATQDGQIACAALSVGKILGTDERVVLVPATAVKYTLVEQHPVVVLQLTKAEIAALPPFDVKKDGGEGLDRAVERARGLGTAPGRARTDAKGAAPGAGMTAAYTLSSQLIACPVNASDTEYGKVHDGVVDPAKQAVGYILVARSGAAADGPAMHVVPFRACQCTCADGKNSLKLAKTSDQLKTAPDYKKPEQGLVTPEQMKSSDQFFGGAKPGPSEGERPN